MKIQNHLLFRDDGTQYPFRKTPNQGVGGNPNVVLKPTWLVMHYTASGSAKEALDWLASKQSQASAHVVIARDGTITQMVPFDRVSWHAGKSLWQGVNGLNSHSIGIELDNAGRLQQKAGAWVAEVSGKKIADADVRVAAHKHRPDKQLGWQTYTQAQLDAARQLAALLVKTYGLKDVIGHDDIRTEFIRVNGEVVNGKKVERKWDPGPAFDMAAFRAAVLGGVDLPQPAAPAAAFFSVTASSLNVRSGPGAGNPTVAGSPLAQGTVVQGLADQGDWKRIVVQGGGVTGWVSAKFLQPVVPALKIAGEPTPAGSGG
jgi:N-acetylmuramoyl-L-alanine amidase